MRGVIVLLALAAAAPAAAQGIPGIPGLAAQPQTPEARQAFCRRVAGAAARCAVAGGLDTAALATCLVRTLPAEDSLRVAQAAQRASGSAAAVLSECGIGGAR